MLRFPRWLLLAVLALAAAVTAAVGAMYARISHPPAAAHLPLPAGEVALDGPEGAALLAAADATADHVPLFAAFQTQEKLSWCGVASAVAVLNAAGDSLTQDGLFTPEASAVRSPLRTTFTGMPLAALAGLISAHGRSATHHFAEDESLASFREALERNLATSGDWLIVNYNRPTLQEVGDGHISPVSAWDRETDQLLLLDTASYKYPPHWIPVNRMFDAMNTPDSESGHSRGWVEVR